MTTAQNHPRNLFCPWGSIWPSTCCHPTSFWTISTKLDKYFVDAGFSPGSAPAFATVSDDELAAFANEIFGFDDIKEVIGAFLADCVGTAVCEITAHTQ